jgi:hypothetical protein
MPPETHILAAVHTTSGRFPEEGFEKVPVHQKVRTFLEKAKDKLELTSIDGWIARFEGRDVDPEKSWLDNDLHGEVVLDFGPRESGGGHA